MSTASPPRAPRTARSARALAEPPGRIEVTHVADRAFALFIREHELSVDQPVEAGGDNDGPTPVELFVAALAACVAADAVRFLQLLDQPYDHLRVKTDFRMTDDGAPRVSAVRLRILLPAPLSRVLREGLHAVVGRCAVHNTLCVPPEVTIESDAPAPLSVRPDRSGGR
ncbi:osmotically inducible protein OsmC [Streptomyces sp. Act143]|uniref:OsmC family protein n=1 Tax=Streptomyces sp. Act143 TaxID=2200760 RepID=UPI000D6749AB|nr:OsmC family protein [Streptomyces sp. Act143]PWI17956.1 osmotically inducible protein OsmC [Streptomyces sp. Act143]